MSILPKSTLTGKLASRCGRLGGVDAGCSLDILSESDGINVQNPAATRATGKQSHSLDFAVAVVGVLVDASMMNFV